jgi:hypothetical protein
LLPAHRINATILDMTPRQEHGQDAIAQIADCRVIADPGARRRAAASAIVGGSVTLMGAASVHYASPRNAPVHSI